MSDVARSDSGTGRIVENDKDEYGNENDDDDDDAEEEDGMK